MKRAMEISSLLLGILYAVALLPQAAFAQGQTEAPACGDDEAMVESYRQDLSGLTDTVRKESLADFEKGYHQRTCLTKLTLSLGLVDELESCLDKAAQDPATSKEQAAAYKAKHDAYAKLKDKFDAEHKELKAAEAPKAAKALIEKFDFSK
jgi:hypothetical protein